MVIMVVTNCPVPNCPSRIVCIPLRTRSVRKPRSASKEARLSNFKSDSEKASIHTVN